MDEAPDVVVGWYDIDAVVHGFWAAVPPRTTAG